MIKFIPPTDTKTIIRQIEALEWQIKRDDNDKDREIHQQALNVLKEKIRGI